MKADRNSSVNPELYRRMTEKKIQTLRAENRNLTIIIAVLSAVLLVLFLYITFDIYNTIIVK